MRCFDLLIRALKINKKIIYTILVFILTVSILCGYFIYHSIQLKESSSIPPEFMKESLQETIPENSNVSLEEEQTQEKKDYIKWVDFKITCEAMEKTSKLDINSHIKNEKIQYNWIELLAYLACKNGGDFKNFKPKDLDALVSKLENGKCIEDLTKDMKFYSYYYETYSSVLGQFIGYYSVEVEQEDGTKTFENKYGIKAFLPIAKNYGFSHYDDFGNSRSYGFKRVHLGNDLMGSIGTPIIAVESGIVEHLGWNQYGGWRVGIKSFDGKRYYYYAHLRKNHPYAKNLKEGDIVTAGDVIGYLGMTGYSVKENVNNINIPHLHFGMQLIFDESQENGNHEIWIDVYQIIEFLKKNRSLTYMANEETKDYSRKFLLNEPFKEE